MSDYTAIRATTKTLEALLRKTITEASEPEITGIPVDLRSPKAMREESANVVGVSLWLYQVSRNADLHNDPPERVAPDLLPRHSVSLNLHYLITPVASTPDTAQAILGRVIQVFNDHAILGGALLRDSLEGTDAQLRLHLQPMSLEELTRVWDALKEPYSLSVAYEVQAVTVASDREPVRRPSVTRRDQTTGQRLSTGGAA